MAKKWLPAEEKKEEHVHGKTEEHAKLSEAHVHHYKHEHYHEGDDE